jgi:hypothetical protein
MSDVFEHNPGDHEDPVAGPTWLIGFIGVVLLVVVFLGVTSIYFDAEKAGEEYSALATVPLDLERLNQEQQAMLDGPPRWIITRVDQQEVDRQLVIPIDEAMQKIAQEMRRTIPGE